MDIEREDIEARPKTALTIVFQSWATPIVGIVMLALGLLGGYFARPLAASLLADSSTAPVTSAASPSNDSTAAQNEPASSQELMSFVIGNTRHFKGDPNALVTIIEFSDYQ